MPAIATQTGVPWWINRFWGESNATTSTGSTGNESTSGETRSGSSTSNTA